MATGISYVSTEILKHAFATQAAHRVFANRRRQIVFARTAAAVRNETVHISRGECDDTASAVAGAHQRRQVRVHGPCEWFVADGSELAAGHEDDVWRVGQTSKRGFVEQIAANRLDAVCLERVLLIGGRETRHANHSVGNTRGVHGAAGHPGKRGPHLARDTQDDDITRCSTDSVDGGRRWLAQQFLEVRDVADLVGKLHREPIMPTDVRE